MSERKDTGKGRLRRGCTDVSSRNPTLPSHDTEFRRKRWFVCETNLPYRKPQRNSFPIGSVETRVCTEKPFTRPGV